MATKMKQKRRKKRASDLYRERQGPSDPCRKKRIMVIDPARTGEWVHILKQASDRDLPGLQYVLDASTDALARSQAARVISIVMQALQNRVHIDVDIKIFGPLNGNKRSEFYERLLSKREHRTIVEPSVLVDNSGIIVAWIFPDFLRADEQSLLIAATREVENELKVASADADWRTAPHRFIPAEKCTKLPVGVTNISGGWFARGRGPKDPDHLLRPSLNFREKMGVKAAVVHSQSVQHLLNFFLALTHPVLYHAAQLCRQKMLEEATDDRYIVELWHSLFHAVAIISNGTSQAHRDTKGHLSWYDMLVSIGTVKELILNLPELHVKVSYRPGTVVFITGHAITHEVDTWDQDMERACWAFFFRSNVLKKFDIPLPDWSCIASYDQLSPINPP